MNRDLERKLELTTLYLRNMQKIKWREKAIKDIWFKKRSTTFSITNTDFCILQIRKILELIALSALVSDVDLYRQHLSKIEKMWNAKNILNDIERIHPDFYPKPIVINPNNKYEWEKLNEPYLTKEIFVDVYAKCGKILHESTPFKSDEQINKEYEEIRKNIPHWISLIKNLLNIHVVHLYGEETLFYISMGGENDKPYSNIFTRFYEDET